MLKRRLPQSQSKGSHYSLCSLQHNTDGTGCHDALSEDGPDQQYLMDRDAEIALAGSAAPNAISHDASVIVLTARLPNRGGRQERLGMLVGRGWMAMFDHPIFGIQKSAPQMSQSTRRPHRLPYAYKRTELLLAAIPSKKSSPQSKPQ